MQRNWPLLLSLVVSLAGCASDSGIHGEAQKLPPKSLAFEEAGGGDWPRADWWTTFGDPKLDALLQQALEGSPNLRAAQARVRTASAFADAARSSLYPTLDLNASAGRQRLTENDLPAPYAGSWLNQGRLALDFNYEFD